MTCINYIFVDNYTERDVRLHISRLRDLLGGPYKPNPSSIGIDPAVSFLTAITGEIGKVFLSSVYVLLKFLTLGFVLL